MTSLPALRLLPKPEVEDGLRTSPVRLRTTRLSAVDGEIDASNIDSFEEALLAVVEAGDRLVLDLSAVEFFGTAGIWTLMTVHQRFRKAGVPWAIVIGPAVRRVIEIAGGSDMLPVTGSVAEGVRRVDGPRSGGASGFAVVSPGKVHC
jgi:anti-anti-sigma factor